MSLFSRAAHLLKSAVQVIGGKVSVGQAALTVLQTFPAIIADVRAYVGSDKFQRIRDAWEAFDQETGIGGLDLVKDMPPEAEERLWDGVKAAGLELSLWAAGFYAEGGNPPSEVDVQNALTAVIRSAGPEALKAVSDVLDKEPEPAAEDETSANEYSDSAQYVQALQAHQANPRSFSMEDRISTLEQAMLELYDG